MAATTTAPAGTDERADLLALIGGADSVELKLTVPMTHRSRAGSALGVDPLEGQIRQAYFFDTPDLALYKSGLVVRARRVQGKGDDSVVKLRPSSRTNSTQICAARRTSRSRSTPCPEGTSARGR